MAYPVHAIHHNVFGRRRKWLIEKGRTLVGFLPVSCKRQELKDEGSGNDEELSIFGLTSSMTGPLNSAVRMTAD